MQIKKQENRAFEEMRKAALSRLAGRGSAELAARTGLDYDARSGFFSLSSLGCAIRLHDTDWEISPALTAWHHLTLLHYLATADGTPLSGELIRFGDLPGGMVRGGGFDRDSERILGSEWGCRPLEQVSRVCRALGGRIVSANADLCALFDVFPFYRITLKLWFADEEMPGSGRLLLDKSAPHFLSVEDAVAAGELLLQQLSAQHQAMQNTAEAADG